MVELRGDLCGFNVQQVGELVQMHPNLLYTHRIAGSSMQNAYTCMVEAIKKGAKYVDVEIEAPVDYLEMLKMIVLENCSIKEAAEKYGITVSACKKRLERIKQRMQYILTEETGGERFE